MLDVRWELATGARRDLYEQGHIPGAAFVDLDAELAGPPGADGRHPLPAPEAFQASMRAAGVDSGRGVVVYDAATSMAAARAWWLLRYFGHRDVGVLDGGLQAWRRAGFALEAGSERPRGAVISTRAGRDAGARRRPARGAATACYSTLVRRSDFTASPSRSIRSPATSLERAAARRRRT